MLRSKLYDKGLLEVAGEEFVAVGDNLPRYTIVSDDIPDKGINELVSIPILNEG
jgi:hypothetical protein